MVRRVVRKASTAQGASAIHADAQIITMDRRKKAAIKRFLPTAGGSFRGQCTGVLAKNFFEALDLPSVLLLNS